MQILDTLITLDVIDWDKTPAKIKTIQLDSQTRYVDAIIQDKGVTYDIGENATVTLTVIRPDKTGVQITGQTKAHVESSPMGEAVTTYGAYAEFTPTALAVKGNLKAQFMITSGGQVLRTEIFTVTNGEALDASTSEWAEEYQGYNLDELVQNVNESVAKVDAMEEDVSDLKEGLRYLEQEGYPMASIQDAVDTWADNHEAEIVNAYVSPEMYGAKGDGITDDTTAWQTAVNSGKNVCAKSKIYKCGRIDVTNNVSIDCNGAEFVCTNEFLFYCSGEIADTLEGENNYTAGQIDYTISDTDYSGYGMILGTNNWEPMRSYYLAGAVGFFDSGIFTDVIPVDCTTPSVIKINPITIAIKNISNVSFLNTAGYMIYVKYGVNCVFENLKVTNQAYSCITLERCYKTKITSVLFDLPLYTGSAVNTYTINMLESCYTAIRDSYISNPFWNAIGVGGNYLSCFNLVDNCKAHSKGAYAIGNHENSLMMTITNCVTDAIGVTAGCYVDHCTIRPNARNGCVIHVTCCAVKDIAKYVIKNVQFMPNKDNTNVVGIQFYAGAQTTGNTGYYDDVTIENVFNVVKPAGTDTTRIAVLDSYNGFSSIVWGTVKIKNTNGYLIFNKATNIFDYSAFKLYIDNCVSQRPSGSYAPIRLPQGADVSISDSDLYYLVFAGNDVPANLTLNNVKFAYNSALKATSKVLGGNISVVGDINLIDTNIVLLSNVFTTAQTKQMARIWRLSSNQNCYAEQMANGFTPTNITLVDVTT